MKEVKIELGSSCELVMIEWEYLGTEVCVRYIEHSTYCMHSDSETEVDIDKETAKKMIGLLQKYVDGE